MRITVAIIAFALAAPAAAAEFKCKGENVEKSGSTKWKVKTSGSDYTVERSGSTLAKVRKRGSKYAVEVSGSTVGTIDDGKIMKSGAVKWTVRDAQKVFDCPDVVAAALYLLDREGKL